MGKAQHREQTNGQLELVGVMGNGVVNVVIGTPIHRAGAYVLDRFLANQKEIQQKSPSSELVLATVEHDFADELEALLSSLGIRGKVLRYETVRPYHAQSRVWDIVCGREAIRQYMLSRAEAQYLLCLDADMTYDPDIIEIMEREIQGYDVVYSGSPLRDLGIALAGTGCCMLTVAVLEEVGFRCLEFKNGVVISEDNLLELDLIRSGKRIKKGFFLAISHYENENLVKSIGPQRVGLYRRVTHSAFVRRVLIQASIALKHNVGWWLLTLEYRLLGAMRSIPVFPKRR